MRQRLRVRVHDRHRKRYWETHDRESATCESCGADASLEIHHRDGDWLNGHPTNLVAVCHACHRGVHRMHAVVDDVAEWKSGFRAILD